jgi:hypothetical protein
MWCQPSFPNNETSDAGNADEQSDQNMSTLPGVTIATVLKRSEPVELSVLKLSVRECRSVLHKGDGNHGESATDIVKTFQEIYFLDALCAMDWRWEVEEYDAQRECAAPDTGKNLR